MEEPKQHPNSEKGQALVLIVLLIIVIFGFAALAVDGGLLFSNRRASQNAADAAALSAAYEMCAGKDLNALTTAATQIAAINGYAAKTSDTENVQVTINNPPQTGSYSNDNHYIEVIISVTRKPVFAGFVFDGPVETTVRAVSRCEMGAGGSATQPGLGGEVSLLALNKTASRAITNTGAAEVIVDGGVFVNSTANDAFHQTGSATMKMNWAKIRGGAELGGAFGIFLNGTGTIAQQIDVVKNFHTSGAGKAISGAFNIGGSVINSASVNMTGYPMNVGGSFDNSGAATVVASPLLIGGGVVNAGSGSFTSENMVVGDDIVASGASWFRPPSGKNLNLMVKGDINLSGSASIGQGTNANVTVEGTVIKTGGSAINGNVTHAPVAQPSFSVAIPEMSDPLKEVLQPPTPPTGSCTNVSFPSWGSFTAPVSSGGYYCNFNVGGSVDAVIPPGTYWVDWFSLGGAAKLKMDGVHLYVTGKGRSNSFSVNGSGSISMAGTMLYLKSGSFSFTGASGTLTWTAPGEGDIYQGLALYLDRANSSAASLTGSAAIAALSGTWYAPASSCSFTGATNTTIYSQFICDTITVTGSSNLKIKYDSTLVYQVSTAGGTPQVSLVE